MEITAKVTSKGQVTIPARVREALRLRRGSRLVFHLDDEGLRVSGEAGDRNARLEALPDFFELAGSVPVPDELKGLSWHEIRSRALKARIEGGDGGHAGTA